MATLAPLNSGRQFTRVASSPELRPCSSVKHKSLNRPQSSAHALKCGEAEVLVAACQMLQCTCLTSCSTAASDELSQVTHMSKVPNRHAQSDYSRYIIELLKPKHANQRQVLPL